MGDVAELGTDQLRFDVAETAQLFTRTLLAGASIPMSSPTSPCAPRDGSHRSNWSRRHADRSPAEIRHFVRTLTGADHELYDYLAEEVVGDLEEDLQRFLMQTSILQVVTPELAEVASGHDSAMSLD